MRSSVETFAIQFTQRFVHPVRIVRVRLDVGDVLLLGQVFAVAAFSTSSTSSKGTQTARVNHHAVDRDRNIDLAGSVVVGLRWVTPAELLALHGSKTSFLTTWGGGRF
jgi:hypothetical protein